MTTLVIFSLEGVLQAEGGRPVDAGCRLYRAIRNGLLYQPVIITAAGDTTARRFFDHEHMPAPARIVAEAPQDPYSWVAACRLIRRQYPYDLDWIITPDPSIAAGLYYEGFRAMLWTDPRYSRPEWRPDAPPPAASSWAALAGDLREDKDLIAADERLSRE